MQKQIYSCVTCIALAMVFMSGLLSAAPAVTVAGPGETSANSVTDDCQEDPSLESQFIDLNSKENTIGLTFYVKANQMLQETARQSEEELKRVASSPHRPCEPPQQDGDIGRRSTCPWYYEAVINDNRYPRVISQAQCVQCNNCFGSRLPSDDAGCQPVYYTIHTLHKVGCVNGTYQYEQREEQISVACTCALRR